MCRHSRSQITWEDKPLLGSGDYVLWYGTCECGKKVYEVCACGGVICDSGARGTHCEGSSMRIESRAHSIRFRLRLGPHDPVHGCAYGHEGKRRCSPN